MKTKTFGRACLFEGMLNNSKPQRLITSKTDMDEKRWEDPPFDCSGCWMTISQAKKLVSDLNKAITYAESEAK